MLKMSHAELLASRAALYILSLASGHQAQGDLIVLQTDNSRPDARLGCLGCFPFQLFTTMAAALVVQPLGSSCSTESSVCTGH